MRSTSCWLCNDLLCRGYHDLAVKHVSSSCRSSGGRVPDGLGDHADTLRLVGKAFFPLIFRYFNPQKLGAARLADFEPSVICVEIYGTVLLVDECLTACLPLRVCLVSADWMLQVYDDETRL